MDTDSELNEGESRPKKPNLNFKIKERLMANRTAESFTDYEGVMSDPKLTLTEKIIRFEKVIGDATR